MTRQPDPKTSMQCPLLRVLLNDGERIYDMSLHSLNRLQFAITCSDVYNVINSWDQFFYPDPDGRKEGCQ